MAQPFTLGNSARKIFIKGSIFTDSVKNKNETYKVNKKLAQCISPVSLSRKPLINYFAVNYFLILFIKFFHTSLLF